MANDLVTVVAIARGYFGELRDEGDVFQVPEGAKGSWFRPVTDADVAADAPEEAEKPKRGKGKARAETVAAPTAAPFSDAPEPVRVQNEVNAATGGTQPDWVAPGDI